MTKQASKSTRGAIRQAAIDAATEAFHEMTDVASSIVNTAEQEADAAVQAIFDQQYKETMVSLAAGIRRDAYNSAYQNAVRRANELTVTTAPVAEVPASTPDLTEEIASGASA